MLLNTFTIICYLLGATTQGLSCVKKSYYQVVTTYLSFPVLILHGLLLYTWIDLNTGQNLTELNLLSLAIWLAALIVFIWSFKKPVAYLNIILFPLAAISIFLTARFPSSHILKTGAEPKQFIHILLSVIAFSVLFIAGLQAVTLAFNEKFLKQKYLSMNRLFPSLEVMESTLFQTIGAGFILLSIVLGTSLYFFHGFQEQFLKKTILTFITCAVFSLLLLGRYYFGWRGKKAIYCTLGGVVLLSVIYFSSIIIMEFLP